MNWTENDPNEWINLADRSEHAAVKAELARWLPKTDAPLIRSGKSKQKGNQQP